MSFNMSYADNADLVSVPIRNSYGEVVEEFYVDHDFVPFITAIDNCNIAIRDIFTLKDRLYIRLCDSDAAKWLVNRFGLKKYLMKSIRLNKDLQNGFLEFHFSAKNTKKSFVDMISSLDVKESFVQRTEDAFDQYYAHLKGIMETQMESAMIHKSTDPDFINHIVDHNEQALFDHLKKVYAKYGEPRYIAQERYDDTKRDYERWLSEGVLPEIWEEAHRICFEHL